MQVRFLGSWSSVSQLANTLWGKEFGLCRPLTRGWTCLSWLHDGCLVGVGVRGRGIGECMPQEKSETQRRVGLGGRGPFWQSKSRLSGPEGRRCVPRSVAPGGAGEVGPHDGPDPRRWFSCAQVSETHGVVSGLCSRSVEFNLCSRPHFGKAYSRRPPSCEQTMQLGRATYHQGDITSAHASVFLGAIRLMMAASGPLNVGVPERSLCCTRTNKTPSCSIQP